MDSIERVVVVAVGREGVVSSSSLCKRAMRWNAAFNSALSEMSSGAEERTYSIEMFEVGREVEDGGAREEE